MTVGGTLAIMLPLLSFMLGTVWLVVHRLAARIDEAGERIGRITERIDTRTCAHGTSLGARIEALDARLTARLDDIDARFAAVATAVGRIHERLTQPPPRR
jgi:hypothetical protein